MKAFACLSLINPLTHLQTLDATPDHPLIDTYNHHEARNNPAYRLIVSEQVRPCFFSGATKQLGNGVRGAYT